MALAVEVCAEPDERNEPIRSRLFDFQRHRGAPVSADLIVGRGGPIAPLRLRNAARAPTKTVFGFLPYWASAANLRYDLLTHVACASVEINSDGSVGNEHGWPWTSVINNAHEGGVKVVLVASLFGSDDILALITSPTNTANFFANMKSKLIEGNADGLNIDFEGSGSAWKTHINAFMSELTDYLHAELPGSEVTIDAPAVNWGSDWDLLGLSAVCDGLFIMGYDFYGSWSTTTGPVAPLTGGSFNITNTVLSQYEAVVQSAPQKLILGVPYYGAHWKTVSENPRAAVTDWVGSITFSSAQAGSEGYGLRWDEASQTAWYRWHDGASWHQVWFDNARSLGLKYDLAIQNDLRGVGMWALGYDGARDELWQVLEEKFGGPAEPIPTVSAWGLAVLGFLVVIGGVAILRRRPC